MVVGDGKNKKRKGERERERDAGQKVLWGTQETTGKQEIRKKKRGKVGEEDRRRRRRRGGGRGKALGIMPYHKAIMMSPVSEKVGKCPAFSPYSQAPIIKQWITKSFSPFSLLTPHPLYVSLSHTDVNARPFPALRQRELCQRLPTPLMALLSLHVTSLSSLSPFLCLRIKAS